MIRNRLGRFAAMGVHHQDGRGSPPGARPTLPLGPSVRPGFSYVRIKGVNAMRIKRSAGGGVSPEFEAGPRLGPHPEGSTVDSGSRSSLLTRVPAGLLDSAFSSLATFIIGLAAVRYLSTGALGTYALAFTGYLLAAAVPASLVLAPMEAAIVRVAVGAERLRLFRTTLVPATILALGSSAIIGALTLAVPSGVSVGTRIDLAIGVVLLGAASPIQDHVRRLMHSAQRSWVSATISLVQLATVGVALAAALSAGLIRQPWLPFTALALANFVSASVGLAVVRVWRLPQVGVHFVRIRGVLRTGGWLLSAQLSGFVVGFAMVAIVVAGSGADAGGYAEAARVLVQPPTVLIVGLMAIVAPEIQRATFTHNVDRALRLQFRFTMGVFLASALWGLVITPDWPFSPMHHLFPRAYVVSGLLIITLVGQVVTYTNGIYNGIYLAIDRPRVLVSNAFIAMTLALVITIVFRTHGPLTLAWAGAIGEITQMVLSIVRGRRLLRVFAKEAAQPIAGIANQTLAPNLPQHSSGSNR
jgi:hypothetical protein